MLGAGRYLQVQRMTNLIKTKSQTSIFETIPSHYLKVLAAVAFFNLFVCWLVGF